MCRMIGRALALAGVLLLLLAAVSAAETPSNACFSPGLVRLSALEAQGAPVSAQAEIRVDNAMYARDLSVLASMLSGTTFDYARTGESEQLRILRGEEVLSAIALTQTDGGAFLEIGDRVFACDEQSAIKALTGFELDGYERLDAVAAGLAGTAILERVPLASVAAWLEGFTAGQPLALGFAVCEPFVLERTMSDDGTRLTRIEVVSGSIQKGDEPPYTLRGYLRQPAGRAPKDTFELVLTQDEKNFIELTYSALRENEVTRRDKAGTTSVTTSLKAAGKIAGSRISSRLNVTMKNAWTAQDGELSEKITITASLNHQDNRPQMRMQRLNSVEAKLKNAIRLTTNEQKNDVIGLSDEISLEVIMDGNTFLAGGADVSMTVGEDGMEISAAGMDSAQAAADEEIAAALQAEIAELSARIYSFLSNSAKEKISNGL